MGLTRKDIERWEGEQVAWVEKLKSSIESSGEEEMEAIGEKKVAGEVMLRTKDNKIEERGVHKVRKQRPDDPKHPGKAQQEKLMASHERSQKPALPARTRLGPICLQPSGNNKMRQVKEVHNKATVRCRKCLKKYKTLYSQTRHEKKHHPAPYPTARCDYGPPWTACELGLNLSEHLHTSEEPGNNSNKELA